MEYQTVNRKRLTKAGKIVIISVLILLGGITFILSKDKLLGVHKDGTYETAKELIQKEKMEKNDKTENNKKVAIFTGAKKEEKENLIELQECIDISDKNSFKGIEDMQMTVYQYGNEEQENNQNIKITQGEPQEQHVEEEHEPEKNNDKRDLARICWKKTNRFYI